jgi:hypothetical protein
MDYTFDNIDNFPKDILSIEKSVPLRSKGRKTEHTEHYSLVSFLEAFHLENLFTFPFQVIFRDRPDVLITSSVGNIGIEITESIPEQLANAQFLLEKNFKGYAVLEPEFFGWDAPDRTDAEIMEILQASQVHLIGQGMSGNSVEERWITGIEGCITKKTAKLLKPEFDKFDINWLLIYDNQSKPMLNKKYVSDSLHPFLGSYWNGINTTFDKIFIDSGKHFFMLSRGDAPLVISKPSKLSE